MPGTNKDRIEEAAIALFAEKGVGGASVAEIAARADVSQGLLYRHWKDKDDMALDLFGRRYFALRDRLRAATADQPTTRSRIAAMIRTGCQIQEEDSAGFRFLLTSQHQHIGRLAGGGPSFVEVVRNVITEGIARGDIGLVDPATATAVVLGIFLQAAVFDLHGDLGQPLDEMAETLADACWRAVDGRDPA